MNFGKPVVSESIFNGTEKIFMSFLADAHIV
jgi:hypothetical protein